MRHAVALLAAVTALALSTAAVAQSNDARCAGDAASSADHRDQSYCFGDEIVQSSLVRPDGDAVRGHRHWRPTPLIQLRAHFVPEMLKSVERL
jgi:hypothetical protein